MARTIYCEECVEEIPGDEVLWEDGRLYCRRCGSELEATGRRDVFEEILDNRTGYVFRDATDDVDEDSEEDEDAPGDDLEEDADDHDSDVEH